MGPAPAAIARVRAGQLIIIIDNIDTMIQYMSMRQWHDVPRQQKRKSLRWQLVRDCTCNGITMSSIGNAHVATCGISIMHAHAYNDNVIMTMSLS